MEVRYRRCDNCGKLIEESETCISVSSTIIFRNIKNPQKLTTDDRYTDYDFCLECFEELKNWRKNVVIDKKSKHKWWKRRG